MKTTATGTQLIALPSAQAQRKPDTLDPQDDAEFISLIEEVNQAIVSDDLQKASQLLQAIPKRSRRPAQHSELAQIAEKLGKLERAILELNMRLAYDQSHLPSLYALARIRQDQGEIERAKAIYETILSHDETETEAALELGRIKQNAGDYQAAIELYRRVNAAAEKRNSNSVLEEPTEKENVRETTFPSHQESSLRSFDTPLDADLLTFATLFRGREGVYARQWYNEGGRGGYTPMREPFTLDIIRRHLSGQLTVGIYPIQLNNRVNFLAFDIDICAGAFRKMRSDRDRIRLLKETQKVALNIQSLLFGLNMASEIEDSGNKGRHIWVFFEENQSARLVRQFGLKVKDKIEKVEDIDIEIFPAQTRVANDGLGNLIKLPLGYHRKTGQRGLFVDAQGKPFANQIGHLSKIARISTPIFMAAISSFGHREQKLVSTSKVDALEDEQEEELEKRDVVAQNTSNSDREDVSLNEKMKASFSQRVWIEPDYCINEDLEVQSILQGCALIRELTHQAMKDRDLDHNGRKTITHTIGCLKSGVNAVNTILSNIQDIDERFFLKTRLASNPTSCAKLRRRHDELCERIDCNCDLHNRGGEYPTPTLYAQRRMKNSDRSLLDLRIDHKVRELLDTKADLHRLEHRKMIIESELIAFLIEKEVEQIDTAYGILELIYPSKEDSASEDSEDQECETVSIRITA